MTVRPFAGQAVSSMPRAGRPGRRMSQNKNIRKGSIPPSAISRSTTIVIITNTDDTALIPEEPVWGGCAPGLPGAGRAGFGMSCGFRIPARPRDVCTLPAHKAPAKTAVMPGFHFMITDRTYPFTHSHSPFAQPGSPRLPSSITCIIAYRGKGLQCKFLLK